MKKSILGILLLLSQYGFSQNSYPGTGGMTFSTGTWHFSDDGYARFYFGSNARTYFGSGNGYEFRGSGGQPIFTIDNTGNVFVRDQLWAQNNLYVYNSTARPAITLKNDVGETPNPQGGGLVAGSAYGGGILFGNHGANTGYQNRYLQLGMVDNGYQFTPAISIPSETLNVGIGTTNPAAKLDVQSSSGPSQDNIAMFRNSFNNSYSAFSAAGSSPTVGTWTSGSQIMELVPYGTGKGIVSSYTGNLVFQTNGRNDRMTITSEGNVGIGATNPLSTFDVARGLSDGGTAIFRGTDFYTHINYSTNEDTYIRGGKSGARVFLNDLHNGNILLANGGGKVGIGTEYPYTKLHLSGFDENNGITLGDRGDLTNGYKTSIFPKNIGNGELHVFTAKAGVGYGNIFLNEFGGNVIIGTPASINNAYQLNVGGIVRANKVVVNTTGADFVFDSTYKLQSLETVAGFIKANKHLPQIASAEEMQKNGLDVGEQQTKLLQKIEELTLYMIALDKDNTELKRSNDALKDLVKKQDNRMKILERKVKK